jgi:K+/H+ antiporter YhaU regulatory subunit KhtT
METRDLTRYVEDLTAEGDYWLSITDAARVCRVQDVSIRRAIARGALPVRRQRAGQNKRTRFVRAGDLPDAGFPIIDESAVITTEIGKADILSIPRQQQRILQDHQQLLAHLVELRDALAGSQALLLADLARQRADFQATLEASQQAQARLLAASETRLLTGQKQLQQHLQTLADQVEQEREQTSQGLLHLHADMLQHRDRLQTELREMQARFTAHQQDVHHLLTDLEARQQQHLTAHQHAVQEHFQQVEQEMHRHLQTLAQRVRDALDQHTRECAQGLAEQMERLEQFTQGLRQEIHGREQALERLLEQQQEQLNRQARLLPLLPYVEKRLLTAQDALAWEQTLSEVERRLAAQQQQHVAHYQPLLSLLSSTRLEALRQLLDEQQAKAAPPPESAST